MRQFSLRRDSSLPIAIVLLLLLLEGCSETTERTRITEDDFRDGSRVYGDVEVRPLRESLDSIANWLKAFHRPAASTFLRGQRASVARAAFERLGLEVPPEVLTLYSWRDGQRGTTDAAFFPGYRLLSVESAVEEYRNMGQESKTAAPGWSTSYLPILKSGTGFVVVDCDGDDKGAVLEWSSVTGLTLGHPSLASFMQEIAEGYEKGAYFVSDDGNLDRDLKREDAVFRRYHPALPSRDALSANLEVKRKEKKRFNGSRVVTVTLSSGAEETLTYNEEGQLTSRVVEINDNIVQEESTEYDAEGRPLSRFLDGYLDESVAWSYRDSDPIEIKKVTSRGTTWIEADLDAEGRWRVLSSRFER